MVCQCIKSKEVQFIPLQPIKKIYMEFHVYEIKGNKLYSVYGNASEPIGAHVFDIKE